MASDMMFAGSIFPLLLQCTLTNPSRGYWQLQILQRWPTCVDVWRMCCVFVCSETCVPRCIAGYILNSLLIMRRFPTAALFMEHINTSLQK